MKIYTTWWENIRISIQNRPKKIVFSYLTKISELEKEQLQQQLAEKLQLINHLRKETEKVEQQMERQWKEMERKQHEILDLERDLKSIDPKDPKHVSKIKMRYKMGILFLLIVDQASHSPF